MYLESENMLLVVSTYVTGLYWRSAVVRCSCGVAFCLWRGKPQGVLFVDSEALREESKIAIINSLHIQRRRALQNRNLDSEVFS